jgi:hypothetical protein
MLHIRHLKRLVGPFTVFLARHRTSPEILRPPSSTPAPNNSHSRWRSVESLVPCNCQPDQLQQSIIPRCLPTRPRPPAAAAPARSLLSTTSHFSRPSQRGTAERMESSVCANHRVGCDRHAISTNFRGSTRGKGRGSVRNAGNTSKTTHLG